MLRCPSFRYYAPATVDEVVRILADQGPQAMVLAGGTDLLPNMKRRQQTPAVLVSLRQIAGLRDITCDNDGLRIGAGVTLAQLGTRPELTGHVAFRQAAAQVATPQIRTTATLGGNLCLDTRCNYYNQSYEWRRAIDFCMKRGPAGGGWPEPHPGGTCWVAPSSPRCWAVSSSDTAPALIALGARVELTSTAGTRILPLAELYRDDGIDALCKRKDELLTAIYLGHSTAGLPWRSTYLKLRRRDAFDFPVLGAAAAVALAPDGHVTQAHLVLGAVASHPLRIDTASLIGRPLDDVAIHDVAERAARIGKPLDNTDYTLSWRKRMIRIFIEDALRELRGDALPRSARRPDSAPGCPLSSEH